MPSTRRTARTELGLLLLLGALSCRFDPAYRDYVPESATVCTVGSVSCRLGKLSRCDGDASGQSWIVLDDCAAKGDVCTESVKACTACAPGETRCDGQSVTTCDPLGQGRPVTEACDVSHGLACRAGACIDLCGQAAAEQSNIGCGGIL